MKSIKLIGLTALAALMAMAFVGASSAMAENTALCKADEEPCLFSNQISHVHEVTLAGAPATLLSSAGNVTCSALFLGDVLATVTHKVIKEGKEEVVALSYLGTEKEKVQHPIVIHGHFAYGGTEACVRHKIFGGTEPCEVTEVSPDSLIEVLKLSHETADITGSGEVNVHCGSVINCTYNGENLLGTAKGPLLASTLFGEVTVSEKTTHSTGGAFCPETGKLDIRTTPLEHTYIKS
jgi:hypothetical protein